METCGKKSKEWRTWGLGVRVSLLLSLCCLALKNKPSSLGFSFPIEAMNLKTSESLPSFKVRVLERLTGRFFCVFRLPKRGVNWCLSPCLLALECGSLDHHHEKTDGVLNRNWKCQWRHSLGKKQLFSHLWLYRHVGVGRWKEVPEGRTGQAERTQCLGDGTARAESVGLERHSFSH